MKKIFIVLIAVLCVCCIFMLTACGDDNLDEVEVPSAQTPDSSENETSATDENTEEHKHDWSDYEVSKEATCTEDGLKIAFCECDEVKYDKIPAKGHYLENKLPCQPRKCLRSGCDYVLAADSHRYEKTVHNPTCTEEGYTEYTCECGATYTEDAKEKLPHTYGEWDITEAASCETDGTKERVCTECGATDSGVIEAHGHSYKETDRVAATCTDGGYTELTCENCNASKRVDLVAKLNHTYADDFACHERACTRENCDYVQEATIEHVYTSETIVPTCTEAGYDYHVCGCGYSYTDNPKATIDHSYTSSVVQPTCVDGGYTSHVCDSCGASYTDSPTAALGHDYQATVTAPTCTTKGYTTHKCSRCEASYVDSETDMIAHTYVADEEDPTIERCSCGASRAAVHTHNYVGYLCDCGVMDPDYANGTEIIYDDGDGLYEYKIVGLNNIDNTARLLVIPDKAGYYSITQIADNAFAGANKLECIYVGANVTTIEYEAFVGLSNLKKIYIPVGCNDNFYKATTTTVETYIPAE